MTSEHESTIIGTWDLQIATPVGRLKVSMSFQDTDNGIAGTARRDDETVALHDISGIPNANGERVTWTQSVAKPLRLTLAFDVVVTGDSLTGVSRAGRLPAAKVTGQRVQTKTPTGDDA